MIRKITFILGLLWILFAVFAQIIGVDHDARWGMSRYIALFVGIALIGAARFAPLRKKYFLQNAIPVRWIAAVSTPLTVFVSALTIIGISVYLTWFASMGLFPTFHNEFNPYVDLGEAFLHGQAALLEKPDPRLALIQDPWNDVAARSQIPYTFDLSYYNGGYYLYWGPAPALIYAAYAAVAGVRPSNQFGMLFFAIGQGVLMTGMFFLARRWVYPRAPGFTIPLFVLAGMLSLPQILLLLHSNVYETAIIAGQFFLFLGLFGWLVYLITRSAPWLVLAGSGYALAIGSRYNLVFCVIIFCLFALFHFYNENRLSRQSIDRAALFLAPLALMGLALAGYNYIRFDNPLEMGYKYQLAQPGQTYQPYYDHAYSTEYAASNFYSYLLYPVHYRPSFPFVVSIPLQPKLFPPWAQLPPLKNYDEVMFGGLFILPVFWLFAILVPAGLSSPAGARYTASERPSIGAHFIRMCLLGALAQFVFLLLFYHSGMRYIADFSLLLITALAFACWSFDQVLTHLPFRIRLPLRAAFWLLVLVLALATALIGVLAGFDLPPQTFRLYNPSQYNAIQVQVDRYFDALLGFYQGSSLFAAALRFLIGK